MPMFKLVTADGVWLSDARLNTLDWKAGDRILNGRDSLEVVEVRAGGRRRCWSSVRAAARRATSAAERRTSSWRAYGQANGSRTGRGHGFVSS